MGWKEHVFIHNSLYIKTCDIIIFPDVHVYFYDHYNQKSNYPWNEYDNIGHILTSIRLN